ncbi:hypothetical protein [Jeotgalibacillus soli]|uniref:Uncharacterized protein n=1 Tax=Jeotgalibacillus soli TaxID=889306 RepID=A0A0C2W801_9BACL|nr:hypothetical protein [Jeotgalibacillus soli]KIL52153.1 hypothetical protein KP78_05230 [Jeotgalibacillus soli]
MKNLFKKAIKYAKDNPEQTKAMAQKAMDTVKKLSSDQKKQPPSAPSNRK